MGEIIAAERQKIFGMINSERTRQDQKWGFPQLNNFSEWGSILAEETGELCKELNDMQFSEGSRERITAEAIHVAAVATSIIEHLEITFALKEDLKKSR